MKRLALPVLLLAAAVQAQDDTLMACTGKIASIPTNEPRRLVVDAKIAGGATSTVFLVTDNCKFSTAGFGVFTDLKAGDNVSIEYAQKEGGTNEAARVTVQNAAPAKAATPKPPPKKTPPKKAPPKKAPAKKAPDPKKK